MKMHGHYRGEQQTCIFVGNSMTPTCIFVGVRGLAQNIEWKPFASRAEEHRRRLLRDHVNCAGIANRKTERAAR